MDKFHFKQIQRTADKVKRKFVNDLKHEILFGKLDQNEVAAALSKLASVSVPFTAQYERFETKRRMGAA